MFSKVWVAPRNDHDWPGGEQHALALRSKSCCVPPAAIALDTVDGIMASVQQRPLLYTHARRQTLSP